MRKIIQIQTQHVPGSYPYVVALCEDGTAWEFYPSRQSFQLNEFGKQEIVNSEPFWKQMPSIPQDEKPMTENERLDPIAQPESKSRGFAEPTFGRGTTP